MPETVAPPEQALHGKEVAITGRLATLTRDEADHAIRDAGGVFVHDPDESTSYLVVGQAGWPLRDDGRPTRALQSARALAERSALEIITEKDFLSILGMQAKVENLERHYTTSQLSRILAVSVGQIRVWLRVGLIRPVKVCHRLSWFDFSEVVRARSLRILTASGVAPGRIARSIEQMRDWLPDAESMLGQIEALSDGGLRVRLANGRVADPRGQLLLDFDHGPSPDGEPSSPPEITVAARSGQDEAPRFRAKPGEKPGEKPAMIGRVVPMVPPRSVDPDAEQWFERGVRLEDDGDFRTAADAYRHALEKGGNQPEIHFNLGNVLFSLSMTQEAIEHYELAVYLDDEYVEAWNNLGNAYAESGRPREAVRAFVTALEIEPGYADVHSNLADTMIQLGLPREAREHLESYLSEDPGSPLADEVRRRLLELADD